MANWQQELQQEIAGIDEVNRNDARLEFRIDTLDDFYDGGQGEPVVIARELIVKAPQPVNMRLVDGLNYLAGDFVCQTAYLRLRAAHDPQAGDPEIVVDGESRTLAQERPFTASDNWGVMVGRDTITIGGDTWTIAGVKALKWLNSEPALMEFTLRK